MSYRNPQQYIDTQSMQIQQNLQKTLSGVGTKLVSDVNKIHEENAKKVEATRANADARVEKAQNSIIQTQSKNPTADFGNLSTELEVMNGILLKDPTKRTAKEKAFVTSMSSIGDTMANSLKNTAMSQEAIIEQANKKVGTMGAIDAKANPELYAKLSVLANRSEGRTVARYKTDKNGQVVFSLDVYEKTKDGERFVGNVINDNVATTQMPDIIPDVNKEVNEFITNAINSVDPTSKLSPVLDKDTQKILHYKDSMGRRVDPAKFKEILRGESVGALAGYTSREIKSLFNNVLKGRGDTEFDYDEKLTPSQEKLANERFVDYMMNQGSVKKILGNIVEEEIPSKKTGKASELEKRSVKEAKKFAKLQKWDGKGTPPVTTISSAINKDIQARWLVPTNLNGDPIEGEEGKWVIEQKNGEKRKNIAEYDRKDFQRLADQLGFDFAGKKNKEDSGQITSENTVIYPDNVGAMTEEQQNAVRLGKLPN